MLSRLASYLLRGSTSGAEDGNELSENETDNLNKKVTSAEMRLRQVEVEGEEWILIDQNVPIESFTGLDESWYVTPPACFTQPGPVHVETSPLEDLLIEHPSMSVYRAAGPTPGCQKTESKKQYTAKRCSPVPESIKTSGSRARFPLVPRNANVQTSSPSFIGVSIHRPNVSDHVDVVDTKTEDSNNNRSGYHHATHNRRHHYQVGTVGEQPPRRPSARDLRNIRGDEHVQIVQIRSAQKMIEKRSTQSTKRNRLERSNKAREVSSGKARRPRRQDRFRLNNSGANNNRKC